jgi:hypothetical protein
VTVADGSGDAGAGEQQRAGGGGRDGNHSVIAQLPEIGADAPAKLAQSAEQPEAAADFEQHFVAGRDAHRGRELSRPQRHALKRFRLFFRVTGEKVQPGGKRERRRYRHAEPDAEPGCSVVARQHPRAMALVLYHHRAGRDCPAQLQLQRQVGKMDGGPQHGGALFKSKQDAGEILNHGGHRDTENQAKNLEVKMHDYGSVALTADTFRMDRRIASFAFLTLRRFFFVLLRASVSSGIRKS